ncbi:MAG: alpha/beta fold hydrolase [Chloroflexi bacterium]|nr:alpha/beta fold hydrolase [Chloroflexota bacterium]
MATDLRSPLPSPWAAADSVWTANERSLDVARAVLGARDAPVGTTPKEVVWRKNKACLYRYLRAMPATQQTPVLLVLPLINRAYILDLRPGASFVQSLLGRGFDVFLLDWGIPGDEDRNLDIETLVTRYLPRAVRKARQAAGVAELTMLGYCIGGALVACYTALYPDAIKNLVLFTAPITFAESGKFGSWTAKNAFPIDELVEVFPTVPGSMPDLGSKMLNPLPSTVGTYVRLWDKLGDESFDVAGWQAMYRWVNEGVPFPGAAFRQWIKEFYREDKLARGTLEFDGRRVLLGNIRCPVLNVAASADAIAPRSTTGSTLSLVGSADKQELLVKGGHVGIVVGRAASNDLWPKVADWLERHD